jgi:hypothetical protein
MPTFELRSSLLGILVMSVLSFAVAIGWTLDLHNADSLIPTLVSLDFWLPFYWGQDRFGMLLPLVAAPVRDSFWNLVAQNALGVFLMLRRMSLVGDAMAHAILPGAAIGFLISGLNLFAMAAGGLIAGFVVALAAGLIARATELKEDASLAAFFLISLAVGVTIVSVRGTNIDLLHFLFGTVLALDDPTLILIAVNATVITSSPGTTPAARSASASASVPLPTPTPCATPAQRAKLASNVRTAVPRIS